MVDEESIIYLSVTALVMLLLLVTSSGYGPLGTAVLVLGLIAMVMLLAINYIDFVVFPAVTKAAGITIVPAAGLKISAGQEAIIKEINGVYYATGYLTGNIYNYVFSAQQSIKEESELGDAVDRWEKIAMNIDFPFKFNVLAMPEGVQTYRDELDGERSYVEFQISKEMSGTHPNEMTIDDLQRKLALLQSRMDRISAGERPLSVIMYIESTAVGVSQKEAEDTLSVQLSQLQTVFNAFDLDIFRITGREVHFLHEFDYKIPPERELTKLFQIQK